MKRYSLPKLPLETSSLKRGQPEVNAQTADKPRARLFLES